MVKVKEDFSNKEKMLKSTIESFKKELSEKTLNNESEMIKVHVEVRIPLSKKLFYFFFFNILTKAHQHRNLKANI